jgi:CMP-N,N'-diacetyllegionaminic acid synthase
MYKELKILGVAVARGGSKGLPGKNIADLGGTPLIAWTVRAAQASKLLDRVIVSTDDPEIAAAAKAAGGDVPFLRDTHLSGDKARIVPVLIDALNKVESNYDLVVLLQTTSPFRTGFDIDRTIKALEDNRAECAISVTYLSKPPEYALTLEEGIWMTPWSERTGWESFQRQRADFPNTYAPNGAVYVTSASYLRKHQSLYAQKTAVHVMPSERSIDIDSAFDFRVARANLPLPQDDGSQS